MENGIKLSALCAATLLFVAPIPDFEEVRRTKRVGERAVFPFVCLWANCAMWVVYGLYLHDIFPTVMTNALGLVCTTYYCGVYAWAVESRAKRAEAYNMFATTLLILCATCVFCFGNFSVKPMAPMDQPDEEDRVKKWAGLAAAASTVVQYASPLAMLVKVVRRRSTEGLSGMLAIVSLVCGSLWMLYGIVVNNPFIYVPNVLGVVFSLVQCSLFLIFPRKGYVVAKKSPKKPSTSWGGNTTKNRSPMRRDGPQRDIPV